MSRAFLPWLSFLWLKWADTALTTAAIAENAAWKQKFAFGKHFLLLAFSKGNSLDLSNIECEASYSGRFDHEEKQLVKNKGEKSHQRLWSGSSNLSQACHKVTLQFLQDHECYRVVQT